MTFPCAIAPLDQAATQLGWHQGTFTRSPCPLLRSCMTRQEGLQFLADPGTPVVAPFDAVVARSGEVITLTLPFSVSAVFATPVRVRITGILAEAGVGPIQKGQLLGRVARATRPAAVFELLGGSAEALFADLGLDIVGGERRSVPGYSLTPSQGGRLLVRSGGPANCAPAALRGFERLLDGLGSDLAPAGYVEPDASPYARFGPSHLTNQNVSPPADPSSGTGWSIVAWLGLGAVALWAAKR